ncbi:MAG: hypothetical protein ACK4S2_14160 [Gemmobacter sp.]|uniref:hypothetical protein n=1 Tax=Gemmobacter sp. TaxID=1898957 RepID=UPI00391C8193
MTRTLAECPAMIFIAHTVPRDAEARGCSPWLVAVDNPFLNAIPGTRHYANWRVAQMLRGAMPVWDYLDFQGLASRDDLERVWFNPDLDAFRAEWLRLWGYGARNPAPVLRHSYLTRRVFARPGLAPGPEMTLQGGTGPVPAGLAAGLVFQVEGVLKKHFGQGGGRPDDWLTPAGAGNPLGLGWLAVPHGPASEAVAGDLAMQVVLIAEPDPASAEP